MSRRVGLPLLVCFLGLALLPMTSARATESGSAIAGASATSLGAVEFESRLLTRINHRRADRGCREFRVSTALELAAQRHTDAMVARHELSHRLAGEADLAGRAVNAGYTSWRILAENLAWGQAGPHAVFRAWVRSAGHRANLDNCRLRDIGIGVVIRNGKPWVTADFGRRRT
jgi:uncharacterized protein YkwD